MPAADRPTPDAPPHIPVLLRPLLEAVAPVSGVWLDGTFGAGGYSRGLLEAGADRVIAVDRDPMVFDMAQGWAAGFGDRLTMVEGTFSGMDTYTDTALDGVVLDLGVSSMQLDQAERGFSFAKDGPLDMRMGADGPTAADLVNDLPESALADILHYYGEERAARRIARAIVAARALAPITTTIHLAEIVAGCLPRPRPGQIHPATRSFQAIRIAVNDELGELVAGLEAAERALAPGGKLAVVTFHSLEDRIVKRFLQLRSATSAGGSRHAPEIRQDAPRFTLMTRRAVGPDQDETATNPRARSAKLRVARRTEAPAGPADRGKLGLPKIMETG
ncbi:rRNA small subunit methyltransferase H [Rhodovulum sp. P5]|uniref:16S rRNA (cytosine(1402)-N(4))-methyltransferase RsmH n=1 Tax=Rhodovulum sp. P5 TaxID=1564506 RepID=UPI0009C28BF7|nr:16S rRNA (cytosine(1402)-N(4))-methyltransferase RsmH [Rhodovulum sp. P5]ARE40052.1 rRNA small subunit methyltransferase H [Rhodovulum sp. P5]